MTISSTLFRTLCATMTLGGCAVGPDFHAPAAPTVTTYTLPPPPPETRASSAPGGASQHFVETGSIEGEWWRAFGSDALNQLVQQALENSPTLTQARMRLVQAGHDYRAQTGASELPQLDAKPSVTRQKVDPAAFGIPNIPEPGPFTLFSASVNVSYALDLFGGNRRVLEGLAALVDYQQFELAAARLSLAGNVVTTVLRRISLAKQIELTKVMLEAQLRQLSIAEQRYVLGGVSHVDLLSQRTQAKQAQASVSPLLQQLAQTDHQLAVYLGQEPGAPTVDEVASLDLDALTLPTEIPLTLPSALARQRPDIRASAALLKQASANIGVATANLYPQITLSGSAGTERTRLSDLLNNLNVWSVGASLTQPLFHGGQLRARKRSAEAAYEAALASYRQTVLQGLQQVADVLRALEHDADELQSRDEADRAAAQNADIASQRYAMGGISELALLDSQRQALQTRLDRVKVQAQRYADTAALYEALACRT